MLESDEKLVEDILTDIDDITHFSSGKRTYYDTERLQNCRDRLERIIRSNREAKTVDLEQLLIEMKSFKKDVVAGLNNDTIRSRHIATRRQLKAEVLVLTAHFTLILLILFLFPTLHGRNFNVGLTTIPIFPEVSSWLAVLVFFVPAGITITTIFVAISPPRFFLPALCAAAGMVVALALLRFIFLTDCFLQHFLAEFTAYELTSGLLYTLEALACLAHLPLLITTMISLVMLRKTVRAERKKSSSQKANAVQAVDW
ncbi:hypothetical protein J8273_7357 [Carpediemonas membranifera]|uniref:Uncharacterized protein n=1 Tax=Carpediemonas membranifera TaxID=201153 RepID=A0A8J6AXV2_9EUKA|nr:hypothetical protein J8273_7357 [Carpediemonas membranifera]|eukprot:KAG9391083.1 hypothetical protein J8273_7357 [Carpediemonas membranifera]